MRTVWEPKELCESVNRRFHELGKMPGLLEKEKVEGRKTGILGMEAVLFFLQHRHGIRYMPENVQVQSDWPVLGPRAGSCVL